MIEVEIRKRQGEFLLDVAFSGPSPGVTALFGRSGAGKSSIIRCVAGLSRPDSGRIAVDGAVFFDSTLGIDLPAERRRVGLVFQDARLFPHMTVESNLRYGWRRAPAAERRFQLDEVVALLGIGGLLKRRPGGLSGGEKQRVAIGRALLAAPRLLLLDEPLASLDAQRKAELLPYLERAKQVLGLPMLFVSHAMEETARLADQLVVIADGKVGLAGPTDQVAASLDLPLLGGRAAAGGVLPAVVAAHDAAFGRTRLTTPAGEFWLPLLTRPLGARLGLRIPARDVILAVQEPIGLSVRNQAEGVVRDVREVAPGLVEVVVAVGDGALLTAEITDAAARDLAITPGRRIWALIKAAALDLNPPTG